MGVSYYPIKNKKFSSIYSSINYEGIKRFVYKLPNSKIDIKDWGKGELKKGKGLLNNTYLKNLKNEMEDFTRNSDLFLKEFIRINKRLPTKFEFYDFYKSMKPSDDYFNTNKIFLILPIFEDIVESRKSGKLLKKGGIRYDFGTIKTYKNTLDSLRGYIEYSKITFTNIEAINKSFILGYEHYLTIVREHKLNYVSNLKKNLKAFLEVLYERDLIPFNPFKKYKISISWEKGVGLALDEEELFEMFEMDLSDSPILEETRDQFLVLAWTGLRISDYNQFNDIKKEGSIVKIFNEKTNGEVSLPMFPKLESILKKYNWRLPKLKSEKQMRLNLKKVGKRISGLNREIYIQYTKAGVPTRKIIKRWEYLNLHVGRRSMISYLANIGINYTDIQLISGHKSLRDLERYIKNNKEKVFSDMVQKVKDRETSRLGQ